MAVVDPGPWRGPTGDEQGRGPTAPRMILGAHLRRLREAGEISQEDAGAELDCSPSKISRLELGRVRLKKDDAVRLLDLYGVTDDHYRDFLLVLCVNSHERGWWYRYSNSIPTWFQAYVGMEESASLIKTCEVQFVPGLLQTEDYAMAIVSHGWQATIDELTRRRVALRMRRQKLLVGPTAPRLWVILDEAVLRRPIGGRDVMRAQIAHLMKLTQQPNIAIQVVPNQVSGYAAEGAFTMLRFAERELPNLVYIEHLTGALYIDKADEVEAYRHVFDRLAVDAETPEQSRELLAKIRAEMSVL